MVIIIILGLIIVNGFLSMSEIALVSARKTSLETEWKKGNKNAGAAIDLMNKPDKFLSAIQIGITLIGIITGLYSGDAFANDFADLLDDIPLLAPYAHVIARVTIVLVVTYLTLVIGELVPKRIGMNKAETIAKGVAHPMNLLSRLMTPFIWVLSKSSAVLLKILGIPKVKVNRVTEEEIKAIVQEGYDTGEVQGVEQDLVERVFNLGDRKVSSMMTHRSEMVWLDKHDSPDEIRRKVNEHLFNVYPVASDKLDNLLGIVSLKDLFTHIDNPGFTLDGILQTVHYIPENLSVYNTLEAFKNKNLNYGIVTDEFGTIEGIITFKDIVEALLGQVPGVGEEPDFIKRNDDSWLVDGQVSFYTFLEHFDMEEVYTSNEFNTLSGLILSLLQHIPQSGEQLTWKDFSFEIMDMDGARIDKVLVYKLHNKVRN